MTCLRGSIVLSLLALTAGLSWALPAQAWGCRGHQTVAYIAQKRLSPEARRMVQDLLQGYPVDAGLRRYCGNVLVDPIADASTWPDDVRNDRKNGPWHYIDIPLGTHEGAIAKYCGDGGCLPAAIEQQRAILKDKSADGLQRAEALRYLVHFVGDLHQPLHTTSNGDNGGNCVPVRFFRYEPLLNAAHPEREDYSPNLHQVWDTEIVERDMEISSPRRYADQLDGKFRTQAAAWEAAGIRVEDWVWESHGRAERHVYGGFGRKIGIEPEINPATCADNGHIAQRMLAKHLVVDAAYQRAAAKWVQLGLAQAGVRLAMILNEAAGAASGAPSGGATLR